MGRNGKYLYDSGRARCSSNKDRAQLEFDDMLIEDFLGAGARMSFEEESRVPVRFAMPRYADELSDSAIASALVDDTRLVNDLRDAEFSNKDIFEDDFVEPMQETVPPDPIRTRAPLNQINKNASRRPFSFRRVAKGFLVGAGVTAGALILISLIV